MAERKIEAGFGEWIKQGLLLYKNNFLVLFIATLLAMAISVFAAGIVTGPVVIGVVLSRESVIAQLLLAYIASVIGIAGFAVLGGPLFAGLALIALRCFDGKEPRPGVGDVFKGFQYFANAFLFVAVWGVIKLILQGLSPLILSPVLLPVVPIVVSVAVGTFSMFGLFLIVDKRRSFSQAFLESIRMALKRFWIYAAVILVAGVISALGAVACAVGVILTVPVYWCIITVVYRDAVKKSAAGA